MGGKSSKDEDQSASQENKLPAEPPYFGPAVAYRFLKTDVVIGTKMSFSFMTSPMITSNIDNYYPLLAAQYSEGYRLLSFYRIPGQQHLQGFSSLALGFQGFFCRYPAAPRRDTWQLRIEKSTIQLSVKHSGIISFTPNVVSDSTHILESITRNTQRGGRLICLEMTGHQERQRFGQAVRGLSPLMGVDLFFEIPDNPQAQQYVYNCLSVPIYVSVRMGFRPTPVARCDWNGILASNLSQGWRLVEIFMDKSMYMTRGGFGGRNSLNSLWFFEKPASHLNDPTPVYEGVVIEHDIKLKTAGYGSVATTTRWEPVIEEMGNRGWELACILETPEWRFTGMATVYMACKLFFQRPVMLQGGATAPSDAPPPYDIAVEYLSEGQGWEGGGGEGACSLPPAEYPFSSPWSEKREY